MVQLGTGREEESLPSLQDRERVLETELKRVADDLAASYDAIRRHKSALSAHSALEDRVHVLEMELQASRAALADAEERLAQHAALRGRVSSPRRGTPRWNMAGDDVGYREQYEAHRQGMPVFPRFSPARGER